MPLCTCALMLLYFVLARLHPTLINVLSIQFDKIIFMKIISNRERLRSFMIKVKSVIAREIT